MNSQAHELIQKISALIAGKFKVGTGHQEPIGVDTALLSSGLNLDSVALPELLLDIETQFGIHFRDEDLSVALFKNVGTLARAVEQKLQREPVPA
jgi:acyl carrier protein